MKNNKFLLMGIALAGLTALTSCNMGPATKTDESFGTNWDESITVTDDKSQKISLNMSIQYQGSETRMSFGKINTNNGSYTGLDGNLYREGDLKPVWQTVSDNLKIRINDVTPMDNINNSFSNWQLKKFDGVDVFQGGSSAIQNEAVQNKTILNLSKYMNSLPNFKDFLLKNGVVRKTITTTTGAIYYAPYFDGYNDAERMMLMRTDWVKKLLDSDSVSDYDTGTEITTAYQAYMPDSLDTTVSALRNNAKISITKRYASGKGIIARMNSLTVKNGQTLVECLKTYISETYGDQYDKLSDLFVGEDAAYDADEYVALLRCVKANPVFLTGNNTPIATIYPRENSNNRVAYLYSLMGQMYGIRGLSSASGHLYIGSDGQVRDARWEQATVDALERFHQMYKEGLILTNFTDPSSGGSQNGKFSETLHLNNKAFSTFDYVQTQTKENETYARGPENKRIDGYCFQPVISPVARWNNQNTYSRFHESWRTVKTEGWALSADLEKKGNEAKLARALTLFDYFWSEEGNRLMSFGPDDYIAKNSDGTFKTISYMGKDVPQLADGVIEQLKTLSDYNYTDYYRQYLGGTFPIGYIKEQGMEYQCTVQEGKEGLARINKALELKVIEYPDVTWTNEDKWYWICPTTFALSSNNAKAVTTNFPTLTNDITNDSSKNNIWSNYVMYGFGGNTGTQTLKTKEEYITYYGTTCNGNQYVSIYNNAFKSMTR